MKRDIPSNPARFALETPPWLSVRCAHVCPRAHTRDDLFCVFQGGPAAPGAARVIWGVHGRERCRDTELPEHNHQSLEAVSKYPFPSEDEF